MPRPEAGERFAAAMKAAGFKTEDSLAKKARVSQSTVGRLKKGSVNSQRDTLERIADALGISISELLREPSDSDLADVDRRGSAAKADLVPLISWVQAGSFTEAIDLYQPGYAEHWVKKPPVPCGPHTFALRVDGISMEPNYQEGDIIYVDPDVQATNGKDVIMRFNDRNEVTFKRLVIEGRRSYLKPLNRGWPDQIIEVPEGAWVAGVVLGAWKGVLVFYG